jgi:ubiquinone biosynthesis protein
VAEVETALSAPIGRLFESFGDCVGAASLAQVHAATLPGGRRVAVKILRPGVEAQVAADARALRLAGALAARFAPGSARLEPRAFVATIIRALQLELDLRFEAAGADELREAMAEDGFMSAPAVDWQRTARRVLTLDWAEGRAMSLPGVLDEAHVDRKRLAGDLIRGFLAQALDHGVFHADLHEGNLFVDGRGRLVAVDFGIVGRLGAAERRYLAEILFGFLERDYARVAEVHFIAGYVPTHHDRAGFAQALRAVGEPIFGRPAAEVAMSRLLIQLFDITALFDMRLRPELVLLQKTMVTVEGVARRIDPGLDIWGAAEPVVRRWIARELSPASRLRDLANQTHAALKHLTEVRPARDAGAPPIPPPRGFDAHAFAMGALAAALAFAIGWLLR